MSELLMGRAAGRYLRLRYEDFVADLQAAVRRVAALAGEEPVVLPFDSTTGVQLGSPIRCRATSTGSRPAP
jgi:hypothetical protein